jgi:hypothetical protein
MTIPYKVRNCWDEIRWWWNPRQKWLIKKIPNHWIDKDTLWEICILEGIKHYVEKDGGLDHFENCQNDPTCPDWQKEFDIKVRFYYEMLTKKLPELERQMEEEWKKVPHFDLKDINKTIDYEKIYGKINQLEKEIYDLKTEIMVWAVTQRNCIWT